MTPEKRQRIASVQEVLRSHHIHVEKVVVDAEKRHWTLQIQGDDQLDHEQLTEKIHQALGHQIQVKLVITKGSDPVFDQGKRDGVRDWIRKNYPGVLLTGSNWTVEEKRVVIPLIHVSDLGILEKDHAPKKLESWFSIQYGYSLTFVFQGMEDWDELSEEIQRMKEKAFQGRSESSPKPPEGKRGEKSQLLLGRVIKGDPTPISGLQTDGEAVLQGRLFSLEQREIRNNMTLVSFHLTDYTSSVTCKAFLNEEKIKKVLTNLKEDGWVKVKGKIQYDTFARENIFMVQSLETVVVASRVDDAPVKRVELHAHTQYSAMDSVAKVGDLVRKAKEFGHDAIAITDHGVLQAYPEAMELGRELGIKVIYGMEGYLVHDDSFPKWGEKNQSLDGAFVVFDVETTGLSAKNSEIIEIGAAKVNNGQIVETYQSFVRPKVRVPVKITELTGISDDMVRTQRDLPTVLNEFLDFVGESTLVAHNARFDMSFLEGACRKLGIEKEFAVVDTLALARNLLTDLSRFNLKALTRYFKIDLSNHHRANDDAVATAKVFFQLLNKCREKGAQTTDDLNEFFDGDTAIKKMDTHHILILVKNPTGLKNLYKLVSLSHLRYFHKRPRIPKSLLNRYREGLIFGTACESGELFTALLNDRSQEELETIVSYYDFLEIQPLGNNQFLLDRGMLTGPEELKSINKRIVALGERFNKPVVATGDVHFLDPEDECYRKVLQCGQKYEDYAKQPPLYYRTTEEMLKEFAYLGDDTAYKVVVHHPREIAESIETITPIPDGTFPPKIEGSDEEIRSMVERAAMEKYGDPLPELVEQRVRRELDSIINNGYSVLYLVAHKLVKKSMEDGYLVGSRGSVGSSLAATFSGITEVNPLPPHYVCPDCKNSEFFDSSKVGSGPDLPDALCPVCGSSYLKDGFDIPFEVFLGFEGDKEPDIDLNFSGAYQSVAHKYTEELFGTGNVFRAGTISTLADKTAYGYVKNYLEENGFLVTNAEISRLVKGCTGVKKTTGQHPGGIMVVPSDKDIYDFCPIQKPADDVDSETITTHFDYHSISGRLLKLDILGHDDPTVIRMLEDLTGLDATKIPLDDPQTMSLFTSHDALGLQDREIGTPIGTYGIPEFGTGFVREMLLDTKPTAFSDLIRISGLSHGTDVWLNNAQELIVNNTATIKEVICTRDDIMVYLIHMGLPSKRAFSIMENVRKGKGLKADDVTLMKEHQVPQWYIDSCNKIKYMFPKAHAVAYVTMAFRIAYFKVHHPLAYYAAYFTVRADDFDAHLAIQGKEAVAKRIREIKEIGNGATAKDKSMLTVLELTLEMICRGYSFLPVQLYESHASHFQIRDGKLLPPFNALEGIGLKAAQSMYETQSEGAFLSIEDLQARTKLSKSNIEVLMKHGAINNLPLSNQISLF